MVGNYDSVSKEGHYTDLLSRYSFLETQKPCLKRPNMAKNKQHAAENG